MIGNKGNIDIKFQERDYKYIEGLKAISFFLKNGLGKELYSLAPYSFYSVLHKVFKKKNLFLTGNNYSLRHQIKFVKFIVSQYLKVFEGNSEISKDRNENLSVVIFDYDGDFSSDFNFENDYLTVVNFDSQLYKSLFSRPSYINQVLWYNSLTRVLKGVFEFNEIEAIEFLTLLMQNAPFEDFIAGKKDINQIEYLGAGLNAKFASILYHLLYQVYYHDFGQNIPRTNYNWTFDTLKEGVYLINFPVTLPIFMRKVITSLFLAKFLFSDYANPYIENNLALILKKPRFNFSLDVLNYESFPTLSSMLRRDSEKLRLIFYDLENETQLNLKYLPHITFQFVFNSIAKLTYPPTAKILDVECTKYIYDAAHNREIASEDTLPKSPIYLKC